MPEPAIRSAAHVPGGFTLRTEICVIGSGAGGGVAAWTLAERGREVVVLEEGPSVGRERMTQREEQMYALLYRDGANQRTDDGAISVLQGRVVGGSTVVNMADVVGVGRPVLDHWRTRFGVDRYGPDAIAGAEAVCREVIGANPIADSQLNRNNGRLVAGAQKLGLASAVLEHNRTGCVGSGYCLIGCAYDAKRSVAITFVPRAVSTGRVIVQSEAKVDRLEHDGKRVTAAIGRLVRPEDGATLGPFRVEADRFVLAAGTVHSPLVLLASGLGGAEVGRNLSLQPQAPVAAMFPDDVVMWRGIPQSAYVDAETATAEDGLGGFRLEGISGGPAMSALSTALPIADLHRFMAGFRRVSACLCLVPDRPSGVVTLQKNGRPNLRYTLTADVEARLKEAIRTAARVWLAAGAEAVVLPFPECPPIRTEADLAPLDGFRIRPAATPLISAHPQGTCRMGQDPATSVVGTNLAVHGVDNLWVMDASIFPTTASSHTQLPTMTWAHLAASEIT